jgi:hypothetical protein
LHRNGQQNLKKLKLRDGLPSLVVAFDSEGGVSTCVLSPGYRLHRMSECARAGCNNSRRIHHNARAFKNPKRAAWNEKPNNSCSSISILTKRPAANPSRENISLQFPFRFSSFALNIFIYMYYYVSACVQYLAPSYISKSFFFTLNLLDRCRPAYRFRISLFRVCFIFIIKTIARNPMDVYKTLSVSYRYQLLLVYNGSRVAMLLLLLLLRKWFSYVRGILGCFFFSCIFFLSYNVHRIKLYYNMQSTLIHL